MQERPSLIAPPPLADETRRLSTLRGLDILDTAPEERFDRLTQLARRLFDVPVALVTLIDDDRQWFKSSAGLTGTQTPRSVSFCGHAIASNTPLVVSDAYLDPRFHDNPFVTGDPYVRFYAGCPLSMPNGSRIGTLCVIDSQPREFCKEAMTRLNDLARMAEHEIGAVQRAKLDELTGLPNRPAFKALAQDGLSECHRQQQPASMLLFGLEGVKHVNDSFGHCEGDQALRVFASMLQNTFRDSGVLGRIAGNEFAVLLWNCSESDAALAAQRVRANLDLHNRTAARGYHMHFSASQVTADPTPRPAVEALLAEVDARMYEFKRSRSVRAFPPTATRSPP